MNRIHLFVKEKLILLINEVIIATQSINKNHTEQYPKGLNYGGLQFTVFFELNIFPFANSHLPYDLLVFSTIKNDAYSKIYFSGFFC